MVLAQARFDRERWSVAAAIAGGACNLLCLVLLNYQIYVVDLFVQQRALAMNYSYRADVPHYPELMIQGMYLAPLLIVIIFRRIPAVTHSYALILFSVSVGRVYYLAQFYRFGPSATSKFDWADLVLTVLGIVSLAILTIWIAIHLASLARNTMKSRERARRDG
jgi:hypothetical protein